MSEFYALKHNRMNRDISILRQLDFKQQQLEDKASKPQFRKFKAHPSPIRCDSDTTIASSPRPIIRRSLSKPNVASSTSSLLYRRSRSKSAFQETKQRAQDFHKLLHEKLSVIDSNPSERSEFSAIGDSYRVSQKSMADRSQNRRSKLSGSHSSLAASSLDSDGDMSNSRCKSVEIRQKNKIINIRAENNQSAVSKATVSGGERRSASSRLSSQKSFCPRGITQSVFQNKFKVIVTKSLQNIADIKTTLAKGIIPPDGEEDESRRAVKVKEFSNRFSRNYLYPLARQLKDLEDINELNPFLVNQKLLSIYQIFSNALQAYQTHLPASLGDGSYNQLKILMGNIIEVCGVHKGLLKKYEEAYIVEFIDSFKINAELTIQKLGECFSGPPPAPRATPLRSERSKISLLKYGNKPKLGAKKSKMDKRFSMYTMSASFRQDAPWKRVVEHLAKKKFNVKSKYKTATYKHRPPLQKDSDVTSMPKLKGLFPHKQTLLKRTRLNLPVNEDFIETMVETEANRENLLEKEEWENMEKVGENNQNGPSNTEEILVKLLQFTLKSHNQGPNEDDKSQISQILTLLRKHPPSEDLLKKILNDLDTNKQEMEKKKNAQELTLEIVKSHCSLSDGGSGNATGGSSGEKGRRKEPKITVTGDKNTRLICITDDNSITEPPENENPSPENEKPPSDHELSETKNTEPPNVIIKKSSETVANVKEPKIKTSKRTQKVKQSVNIKISRLKKPGRNLQPLDRKQAVDAIQYKLDFYRYCKNNPMYKRSTTCQPWILMSKISEELLNQCFLTVAREIEINDIVEKVYQSELQL